MKDYSDEASSSSSSGGDVASAHLSLLHPRAAVQTQVDVSVVVEELLQHVQHPRHLSEDQHPVAAGLQLPQQSVERLKFTCTHTHTQQVEIVSHHQ